RFSLEDAAAVKGWERKTNHDVKAVELWLGEQLERRKLTAWKPWLHFGLTSEDVNNLAYTLNWKEALESTWLPLTGEIETTLRRSAREMADIPLLALTHGQPATPTTLGKEWAVVGRRLARQLDRFASRRLTGKLSGATGTWAAHHLAYPRADWLAFSRDFVESLGLEFTAYTTQVESYDSLAEDLDALQRIHSLLIDFVRDLWLYISRGIFRQQKKAAEVGSSTMPHKINPIFFENAEGNLGLANALLQFLARHLTRSRLQRDLSGSTLIRNLGVALGYSYLGIRNILQGLSRIEPDRERCRQELNDHWEVLAEAIQTLLRKEGDARAYERMKEFSRGEKVTRDAVRTWIASLPLSEENKQVLKALTPDTYLGLARKLAEEC
ncbi:MAG: adenylosuccinate lyase, partial [Candidatus Neomarinimicrobiota bacterium]